MKFFNVKIKLLLFCFLSSGMYLSSQSPDSLFFPYERFIRAESWDSSNFKVAFLFEDGSTKKARDGNENTVNILRMYNPSQSSIAMLLGAAPGTKINQFANSLIPALAAATDDGFRGRFLLNGEIEQTAVTSSFRYKIPGNAFGGFTDIGVYFPIKRMAITDVEWLDQTKNLLSADLAVQATLTSVIDTVASDLGGLRIRGWEKIGLGDLTFMFKWHRDFIQKKRNFKGVRISLHAGITTPTGERKDEEEALSCPFGNDGAWGIPLGAALDLDFSHYFRIGLEVNFLTLFDETSVRRMKTDLNQTDFLLLNKGNVTKSFGEMWRFTSHAQLQNLPKGFSALVAYQFTKHDSDTLYPQSNGFSHYVVNSAANLQEWKLHNLVFQLTFDAEQGYKNWVAKPLISLFYKLPFTGKIAMEVPTFGGQIGIAF